MSAVRKEWYQLRNAVFSQDDEAAEALLQAHPELLEQRNGIGETVLHFLAVEDCLRGIAWLHERGASLTVENKFGTPVLFEVAQLGYRDLLRWLVAHGADLRHRNRDGQSLPEYLLDGGHRDMLAFILEMYPDVFPEIELPIAEEGADRGQRKGDAKQEIVRALNLMSFTMELCASGPEMPWVDVLEELALPFLRIVIGLTNRALRHQNTRSWPILWNGCTASEPSFMKVARTPAFQPVHPSGQRSFAKPG